MKRVIAIIIVLYTFFPLLAQQKLPPIEKLVYTGYYNWGIIWIRAGLVEFTMGKSEKYPEAVLLNAVGYSLPSWDWVFKLRDTLTSEFHSDTFLPYEFSRKAHEGNYHKTFDYSFDYTNQKAYGVINKIGKYIRQDTIELLPETYDMLSVAWMARGLDFDKLKPKDTVPIKILIDSKIYNLYIRYLGVEKIKVGKKKWDSYVFSPLLVEGDVFKGGENMKIWVSKDENRVPLMVEAKILVGSVKGILDLSESKFGD